MTMDLEVVALYHLLERETEKREKEIDKVRAFYYQVENALEKKEKALHKVRRRLERARADQKPSGRLYNTLEREVADLRRAAGSSRDTRAELKEDLKRFCDLRAHTADIIKEMLSQEEYSTMH